MMAGHLIGSLNNNDGDGYLRKRHLKSEVALGAFHLGKRPGNFGGSKSGISDW